MSHPTSCIPDLYRKSSHGDPKPLQAPHLHKNIIATDQPFLLPPKYFTQLHDLNNNNNNNNWVARWGAGGCISPRKLWEQIPDVGDPGRLEDTTCFGGIWQGGGLPTCHMAGCLTEQDSFRWPRVHTVKGRSKELLEVKQSSESLGKSFFCFLNLPPTHTVYVKKKDSKISS